MCAPSHSLHDSTDWRSAVARIEDRYRPIGYPIWSMPDTGHSDGARPATFATRRVRNESGSLETASVTSSIRNAGHDMGASIHAPLDSRQCSSVSFYPDRPWIAFMASTPSPSLSSSSRRMASETTNASSVHTGADVFRQEQSIQCFYHARSSPDNGGAQPGPGEMGDVSADFPPKPFERIRSVCPSAPSTAFDFRLPLSAVVLSQSDIGAFSSAAPPGYTWHSISCCLSSLQGQRYRTEIQPAFINHIPRWGFKTRIIYRPTGRCCPIRHVQRRATESSQPSCLTSGPAPPLTTTSISSCATAE